jgi:ubiquinone/menaquinone biosynthesis C-methylase UbiE
MKDYVSVVYDEKRTPKTDYPGRLIRYLIDRFGIPLGSKLLEIGCGRGEFLEFFQRAGLDCYGVDLSDYCKKNTTGLKVDCLDVAKENLPYSDDYFDVVYHKSVLEHLYSPDRIMQETYRVLKPGGRIIVLTPDWLSQMKTFYEDFTHCRPYTKSALQDVLGVYGFSDVHVELFYQYPAIWKYPVIKAISKLLQLLISTPMARKLTALTKIKYFRWSVELMVLGYGKKQKICNEELK